MITGVQANLWTEHIPTPEYAEYMLYPRALALAEIGWNGAKTKNYPEFKTRALAQIEHLKAEGVNPFELKKEIGERKEKMKPVMHKAVALRLPITMLTTATIRQLANRRWWMATWAVGLMAMAAGKALSARIASM